MCRAAPGANLNDDHDELIVENYDDMATTQAQRQSLAPPQPPVFASPGSIPAASSLSQPPAIPRVPSLPTMRPPQMASWRASSARYLGSAYSPNPTSSNFSPTLPSETSTQYQPAPRVVPMFASAVLQGGRASLPVVAHPLEQTPAFASQHSQQVAVFPFGIVPQMAQHLAHNVYQLGSNSVPPSQTTNSFSSASSVSSGLEVSVPPQGDFAVTTASSNVDYQEAAESDFHAYQAALLSPMGPPQGLQLVYTPASYIAVDRRRPSQPPPTLVTPVFRPYYPTSPPPNRSAQSAIYPSQTPSSSAGVSPVAISGPRHIQQGPESWSASSVESTPHMSTQRIRFVGQEDDTQTLSSKRSRDFEHGYSPTPSPPIASPPRAPDPFVLTESDEDDVGSAPDEDIHDTDFVPTPQLSPRKRGRGSPRSLQPPLKRLCGDDNAIVALFERYPSLPSRFPLLCFALERNLSLHEPAVPMIKSLSQALSPLQKCEELKKLWHKGRRILAQLDAFVARCERKVIRPGDEKLPELDSETRQAIRQVRRKIVERCENYKYTRRDTLNKHVGKNNWEPIEEGMVVWYEGMANNDPANDLGSFRPQSTSPHATASTSYAQTTGAATSQAPASQSVRSDTSRKAYAGEATYALTSYVPEPSRQSSQPSGMDESYSYRKQAHMPPVGDYSGLTTAPGATHPTTLHDNVAQDSVRAVPQSGTSSLNTSQMLHAPQDSPSFNGVNGVLLPSSNSVPTAPLGDRPAAAEAGNTPPSGAAAEVYYSLNASTMESSNGRSFRAHESCFGPEDPDFVLPTTNHVKYQDDDDLHESGGSVGLADPGRNNAAA